MIKKIKIGDLQSPTLRLIERVLSSDDYSNDGCDFTSSQINGPPQRTWLAQNNDPVQDPMRNYASFQGTAAHAHMEDILKEVKEMDNALVEKRFKFTFKGLGLGDKKDIVFGGKPDIIVDGFLDDWKFVSPRSSSAKPDGKLKDDYISQARMNSWLAIKNGVPVHQANVIHWLRDWSVDNAFLNPTYPQEPLLAFSMEVGDLDEIEEEIRAKITLHEGARMGSPRKCTMEERWQNPPSYAVGKPSNKRARRVYPTLAEAQAELRAGEILTERTTDPTRCVVRGKTSWCGFTKFCPQCKGLGSNKSPFPPKKNK